MAPFRSLLLAALLVSAASLAMGQATDFDMATDGSFSFDATTCRGCTLRPAFTFVSGGRSCVAASNEDDAGSCLGTCPVAGCDMDCQFKVFEEEDGSTFLRCGCLGGVCGDPHFYNQGVTFDFHGLPDHEYCLISDQDLSVSAHMVGQDVTATGETGTWMSRLGFLYNHQGKTHKVSLALKDAEDQSTTEYTVFLTVDGVEVALFEDYSQAGIGLSVAIDDEGAYNVEIEGHASLHVRVSEHTAPDGFHFDFTLRSLEVSPNVHGVLGQTYQVERAQSLQIMANSTIGSTKSYTDADILEGAEGDYEVSGLFETDFKFNRFMSTNGALITAARKLLVSEEGTPKSDVPFFITMTGKTMQLHERH